ncbi:MAG: hypothetical protein ACXQT4_01850 [Methanotrichaceae archaeon]
MRMISIGWRKKGIFLIVAILLMGLVSSVASAQTETSDAKDVPLVVAEVVIIGIIAIFVLLIFMGWVRDRSLDKGEMRRAIAGCFVTGFTVLAILSLVYDIEREGIVTAYIEMVGIVIGFYFGSKMALKT